MEEVGKGVSRPDRSMLLPSGCLVQFYTERERNWTYTCLLSNFVKKTRPRGNPDGDLLKIKK